MFSCYLVFGMVACLDSESEGINFCEVPNSSTLSVTVRDNATYTLVEGATKNRP